MHVPTEYFLVFSFQHTQHKNQRTVINIGREIKSVNTIPKVKS